MKTSHLFGFCFVGLYVVFDKVKYSNGLSRNILLVAFDNSYSVCKPPSGSASAGTCTTHLADTKCTNGQCDSLRRNYFAYIGSPGDRGYNHTTVPINATKEVNLECSFFGELITGIISVDYISPFEYEVSCNGSQDKNPINKNDCDTLAVNHCVSGIPCPINYNITDICRASYKENNDLDEIRSSLEAECLTKYTNSCRVSVPRKQIDSYNDSKCFTFKKSYAPTIMCEPDLANQCYAKWAEITFSCDRRTTIAAIDVPIGCGAINVSLLSWLPAVGVLLVQQTPYLKF